MPNITLDGEYQTRDGRPVRVLCVDAEFSSSLSVVALIKDRDGFDATATFRSDGCYMPSGTETVNDLIPVPKKHKRTYWLVHHVNGDIDAYPTSKPNLSIRSHHIAITGPHEIEFTEGEGLKGADDAQADD